MKLTQIEKRAKCESCEQRRNYFCKRHADEVERIIQTRDTCEGWNNVPVIQKRSERGLAVVSCYFNPTGCIYRERAFLKFVKEIQTPITVIELSYNGRYLLSDSIHISGGPRNVLWQKERLINLAIETIDPELDVAWIDSDLVFHNKEWYRQTQRLLRDNNYVQLFDRIDYLTESGEIERSVYSWGADKSGGLPGGAWAARRESLPNGLPDRSIVGGGDWDFIRDIVGEEQVGVTPGIVEHLYHGDYEKRQTRDRKRLLVAHGFNAEDDLQKTSSGLWEWRTDKPDLQKAVADFFTARSPEVEDKPEERRGVDVFIPYYTSLEYVSAAIDSILWQRGVDPVIHLVDDCSPEDDSDLRAKYGSYDSIRWYRTKENSGPYRIYNALVNFMETDYLALLGSDDIALPGRLERSLDLLDEDGSEVYFGSMEQFLSPGSQTQESRDEIERRAYYRSDVRGNLVNGTMLISRRLYESLNGFENVQCGADTDFTERIKRSGCKISIDTEVVALRRLHKANLSLSDSKYGRDSQERAAIAQEWKDRRALWSREGCDLGRYGGLRTVGSILETSVGSRSKIWKETKVEQGALIGADCVVGQRVEIGSKVSVGDRTRLQSNVFIPNGVTIGADVFVGPGVLFTNDKYPPSNGAHWRETQVARGASIGAGSVILPGVRIGSNATIGAGSVVTKDVANNSTGYGNPYREKSREEVVVGIATYPSRLEALLDTIDSLVDQVDRIEICLNEYEEVPYELQYYSKVRCSIPDYNTIDLGKFWRLSEASGYFLSCDDDLIYPEDYAESMVCSVRRYGGAVSHLGRVLPVGRHCRSYYRDVAEYYHCIHEVKTDQRVHIVGTGVLAFHTDIVDQMEFDAKEERPLGIADIQFSSVAEMAGVPLTSLAHSKEWIKHSTKIDLGETIYARSVVDDTLPTLEANKIEWSRL